MITNFTREGDAKYDNQSLKIFLGKHIIELSMVRYNLLHMVWVFSLDNMVGVLAFQFLKYFVSAWCGERRRRWEIEKFKMKEKQILFNKIREIMD